MKKKVLVLFSVLMFLVLFSGCSSEGTIKEIQKKGKIFVAVEDNSYPNVFKNPSSEEGEFIGIDIEIIDEVAKKIALPIEYVYEQNKSAASFINTKQADIAMSGIPLDESVKINYLCSIPYDNANMFSVTKRGISYATVGALKGRKIGFTNEFADNFRKTVSGAVNSTDKNAPKAVGYDNVADALKNLLDGNIDVFLCYEHHAAELIKNKDIQAEVVSNATREKYVFLMNKKNKELQALVNETITEMIKDGTLDEIRGKYLLDEDLYKNKIIKESRGT